MKDVALRAAALLAAMVACVGLVRCGQAILTAPANSDLSITANPPFITAHGGVSVISVLVVEPVGTVVPDGTVVQFFTTLGRIQEQGKTNDGVARVNLESTGLSGIAEVTAVSGGTTPSTAPSGSPTPSPTGGPTASPTGGPSPSPSASATPTPRPTFRPPGPRAPFAAAQGSGSVSVLVAIGSALPARIAVTTDSSRLTAQRPVLLRAFVLDQNGNPVANAPVFFKLTTPTTTERLDSGGDPVFTDTNGLAEDVLRTTAPANAPPRTIQIDVTAANQVSGSAVVTVN